MWGSVLTTWSLLGILSLLSLCSSSARALSLTQNKLKNKHFGGAWVAQSVERLTSTQVMISQSMSSSPAWGSVLTARA